MADRWAVVDALQARPALPRDPPPDRRQRHHHRSRGALPCRRQRRLRDRPRGAWKRPSNRIRSEANVAEARLKLAVQKSGRLTDPSLDLLARCGLKLSRGKDQLIGVSARTCRSTCCSCAMTTFPTWCRRTCATWGWSASTCSRKSALELQRARATPRCFEHPAHARLRPLPAVARACRTGVPYEGLSSLRGQAHRDHLSAPARALPARARSIAGGDRDALGCGRDRAAPGACRSHLRSGLHRLDAAGESPARGRDRAARATRC